VVAGCSKWVTETMKQRITDTVIAIRGMVYPGLTIVVILRGIALTATSWRPIIRCHRTKVWMILDRVLCEKQQKKHQHNFSIAAGMGTLVSLNMRTAMMNSTISASGRSRILAMTAAIKSVYKSVL